MGAGGHGGTWCMGRVMLLCAQRPGNTGGLCEQLLGGSIVSQALGMLARLTKAESKGQDLWAPG